MITVTRLFTATVSGLTALALIVYGRYLLGLPTDVYVPLWN